MTQERQQRASRSDILEQLDRLVGGEAQDVVALVTTYINADETESALAVLKAFDAKIGGVGLHEHQDKKLPGVYRALSYVEMCLHTQEPAQFSRYIVHVSCAHVENMLKRMARLGFIDRLRADRLPIGTLADRMKKRLPEALYHDLKWLSSGVGNFAKHEFDLSERNELEPEHFFDLDEAIAVYLICRRLAVELEKFGGKSREEL